MSKNGPIALVYHTLFVTFMLAPILVVCFVAFTPEGYLSFPTDRWSLRWFYAIGRYPEFISAFWRSLWLGALSSAIAVAFSVPAALAIGRHRFRGRDAMTALFMSPLMIPHVVLGIAFLRFFTELGLGGTFAGLVLAHIVIVLPFALRLTLASARRPRPFDRACRHLARRVGRHGAAAHHLAAGPARPDQRLGARLHQLVRRSDHDGVHRRARHRDAAGAHVPLHPGQYRSAGHLGVGLRHRRHRGRADRARSRLRPGALLVGRSVDGR